MPAKSAYYGSGSINIFVCMAYTKHTSRDLSLSSIFLSFVAFEVYQLKLFYHILDDNSCDVYCAVGRDLSDLVRNVFY